MSTSVAWEHELQSWLEPFLTHLSSSGPAAHVPALCGRPDRAGRAQEPAADGRSGGARRLRSAAPLRGGRPLGRGAARSRTPGPGQPARRRARRHPGDRRHGAAQEGHAFRRGRPAICRRCWARTPIARPSSRSPWPRARCRSRSCLRLFLPETWIEDPERLQRAGVPEAFWTAALQARDRAGGTRRVCAGGRELRGGAGRCGLRHQRRLPAGALGARTAVGRGHPAHPEGLSGRCAMVAPRRRARPAAQDPRSRTRGGRGRGHAGEGSWRRITWRRGTKGPLQGKFAAVRVRVADGPAVRLHGRTTQHLPGEEVWLVGEHRSSGERKYYLSNLPPDTPLKRLAALIKARWVCEQAHQQLKEELGLDHFEGRSWRGSAPACADDADRLPVPAASALARRHRGKKEKPRATAATELAGHPAPAA